MTTYLNDNQELYRLVAERVGNKTSLTPEQTAAIAKEVANAMLPDIADEVTRYLHWKLTMTYASPATESYYPIRGPLPDDAPARMQVQGDYGEPTYIDTPHPVYRVLTADLPAFCRDHRLEYAAMLDVVEGRRQDYKGYEYSGHVPYNFIGRPAGKRYNAAYATALHLYVNEDKEDKARQKAWQGIVPRVMGNIPGIAYKPKH